MGLIGDHDGDDISRDGGFAGGQNGEAISLGLGAGGRAGLETDHNVADTGVAQVEGMGPALTAVADDGDALAANDGKIAVAVMEDGERGA